MKKLLVIVLFLSHTVLSQSKKEQIEKLTFQLSKLQNEVNDMSIKCLNEKKELLDSQKILENQISKMNFQLERTEIMLEEEKSNSQLLNARIEELNKYEEKSKNELNSKIIELRDSINACQFKLDLANKKRDFTNGMFTDAEIAFLAKKFEIEVSKFSDEKMVVEINEKEVIVHAEGERGYVPEIGFNRNFNTAFAGDLDLDGINEIIFDVWVSGGGSDVWGDLYCLKLMADGNFKLINLNVPCACTGNLKCREPSTELISATKNILTIASSCYESDDAMCCPSTKKNGNYSFKNESLLLIK